MTYEEILARSPLSTQTGDARAAQDFVDFLTTVIEGSGEVASLNDSQRNYLYKLRAKWRARSQGQDSRWAGGGSSIGGRPKGSGGSRSKKLTGRRAEETTDLFDKISRKFGKPEDA
jgi:hypothetical protein